MGRNNFRRVAPLRRRELIRGLLLFLILVLLVLYGMYLGIWLLKQEEAQEPQRTGIQGTVFLSFRMNSSNRL